MPHNGFLLSINYARVPSAVPSHLSYLPGGSGGLTPGSLVLDGAILQTVRDRSGSGGQCR